MVIFNKYKINKKDVGLIEDALYTVRNLVAWEDHLSRHIEKETDEKEKIKLIERLDKVRVRRSLVMDLIVTDKPQHSEWCQTKHALNSSMGFMELANRFTYAKDMKKAIRCFKESAECENDIFELNKIERKQKKFFTDA